MVDKVKGVIHRMRRGREMGPDKISVDFWKCTRGVGMEWLTQLFNIIFKTTRMLEA